jgi:hypothetical protein
MKTSTLFRKAAEALHNEPVTSVAGMCWALRKAAYEDTPGSVPPSAVERLFRHRSSVFRVVDDYESSVYWGVNFGRREDGSVDRAEARRCRVLFLLLLAAEAEAEGE